jgi:hypothetical protein
VLIYVDWSSQEYLIAAALSGDERMLADYAPYDPQGDPYIRFGEHGGQWPMGATKKTHPELRERLKVAALATLYGQTAPSLAVRLGVERHVAQHLLGVHARVYARFWEFQREYVRGCLAMGHAWTILLAYARSRDNADHQPDELADAGTWRRDDAVSHDYADGGWNAGLLPGARRFSV